MSKTIEAEVNEALDSYPRARALTAQQRAGGSPCSCEADHATPCSPDGEPPTDLRAIVRAELDRRGKGAPRALAKALRGRWGKSDLSREQQLSRWLNGVRKDGRASVPLYVFEAIVDALDLVIVPRPR